MSQVAVVVLVSHPGSNELHRGTKLLVHIVAKADVRRWRRGSLGVRLRRSSFTRENPTHHACGVLALAATIVYGSRVHPEPCMPFQLSAGALPPRSL